MNGGVIPRFHEMKVRELTLTSSAQVERKEAGLSTCSSTSMEHTTSYRFSDSRSDSAGVCIYDSRRSFGSADAWSFAIAILDSEASTPSVLAPRRARLYQEDWNERNKVKMHADEPLTITRPRNLHPEHLIRGIFVSMSCPPPRGLAKPRKVFP